MLVDGVTVDPARASDRDRWRWKIAGVDRVGAVRTLYGVVLRAGSVTDRLGEVRLPVLAVAGAEDKSFGPERVRTMVKRLPESQFRLIQDAGHAAAIEQPAREAAATSWATLSNWASGTRESVWIRPARRHAPKRGVGGSRFLFGRLGHADNKRAPRGVSPVGPPVLRPPLRCGPAGRGTAW